MGDDLIATCQGTETFFPSWWGGEGVDGALKADVFSSEHCWGRGPLPVGWGSVQGDQPYPMSPSCPSPRRLCYTPPPTVVPTPSGVPADPLKSC